jgi:hypothetical protein
MYSIQHYVIVCQWFSSVSSTNKTDCHEITEILLKVALNTINPKKTTTVIIATRLYLFRSMSFTAYCNVIILDAAVGDENNHAVKMSVVFC